MSTSPLHILFESGLPEDFSTNSSLKAILHVETSTSDDEVEDQLNATQVSNHNKDTVECIMDTSKIVKSCAYDNVSVMPMSNTSINTISSFATSKTDVGTIQSEYKHRTLNCELAKRRHHTKNTIRQQHTNAGGPIRRSQRYARAFRPYKVDCTPNPSISTVATKNSTYMTSTTRFHKHNASMTSGCVTKATTAINSTTDNTSSSLDPSTELSFYMNLWAL